MIPTHNHGPEDGPGLACVEYGIDDRLVGSCVIREWLRASANHSAQPAPQSVERAPSSIGETTSCDHPGCLRDGVSECRWASAGEPRSDAASAITDDEVERAWKILRGHAFRTHVQEALEDFASRRSPREGAAPELTDAQRNESVAAAHQEFCRVTAYWPPEWPQSPDHIDRVTERVTEAVIESISRRLATGLPHNSND